jgi:ABC-type sugar transport system ATPase subunit
VRLGDGPGRAQVVLVERHGADAHVELRAAGTSFRARAPGFTELERGAEVAFEFVASELRWFDAESRAAVT